MINVTQEEDRALCHAQIVGERLLERLQDKPDKRYYRGMRKGIEAYIRAIEYERIQNQNTNELWDIGISTSMAVAEGMGQ